MGLRMKPSFRRFPVAVPAGRRKKGDRSMSQQNGSNGYSRLRHGLFDHFESGRLSEAECFLFLRLLDQADYLTGIVTICARSLANPKGQDLKRIQNLIRRLRKKGFINFSIRPGAHDPYDALIHKFEPTDGPHRGTRLNAWAHGTSAIPEYEKIDKFEMSRSRAGHEQVRSSPTPSKQSGLQFEKKSREQVMSRSRVSPPPNNLKEEDLKKKETPPPPSLFPDKDAKQCTPTPPEHTHYSLAVVEATSGRQGAQIGNAQVRRWVNNINALAQATGRTPAEVARSVSDYWAGQTPRPPARSDAVVDSEIKKLQG